MAESLENRYGPVPRAPRKGGIGRLLLDAAAEAILNTAIFVYGFIWWSFRWSVATLIMLAIMAVSGYYVFNKAVAGGEYITVPDIVNRPYSQAMRVLTDHHLEPGTPTHMESDHIQRDYVIAQRPNAGEVVRAGRRVYPYVSAGKERISVPSVLYMTEDEAVNQLMQEGFSTGHISRIPYDAEAGTVLAQDPAPLAMLAQNGRVNLLVSQGRKSEQGDLQYIPDLIDMPVDEAAARISELGLTGIPVNVERQDAPRDVVLDQDPAPGSMIAPGQVVYLSVRLSSDGKFENLWREASFEYKVPETFSSPHVRIEVVNKKGVRTVFNSDYYEKPLRPGNVITIPEMQFFDSMTIKVYLNGQLAQTAYYEGDKEPEVTNHLETEG